MTPGPDTWSLARAAKIAGAAYLITSATSFSNLYFSSRMAAPGDFARTATNIVANAELFRVLILFELVTCLGCVVLNAALYELLAPVHRSLARLAAFFRIAESAVYGAITVNAVVFLSILTGAEYARALQPPELQALARAFRSAHSNGFTMAMVFLSLGSAVYMYLLLRSRYVPNALAVAGIVMSVLGAVFFVARLVVPAFVAATFAAVRGLPTAALALLAVIAFPFLAFEVILGLWLLVKGIRIPG
jgi:uncharacterized protein DUF4386